MKRLTIYMDDSVHKQIKALCVELDRTMTDFIVSAAVKQLVEIQKASKK